MATIATTSSPLSLRTRATTTSLDPFFTEPTLLPTPTFSTSTDTNSTKNPFSLTTIAAIVIPILIVLSIFSILYRRRRRAQATSMVMVNHPNPTSPTPKFSTQTWNQPHLHQDYPQAPGRNNTFQQRFVANPPLNMPAPPQPAPNQMPYRENPGMGNVPMPEPVWQQSSHYQQSQHHDYPPPTRYDAPSHPPPTHYDPPPHPPPTRYDPPPHPPPMANPSWNRTQTPPPSGTGITYDQFLEEVERMPEPDTSSNPYTSENQNQPPSPQNRALNKTSYTELPAQDRRSRAQAQNVVHDNSTIRVNDGEQLSGGSRQAQLPSSSSHPSGSSTPQQSWQDPIAPIKRDPVQAASSSEAVHRKGDVVLEWSGTRNSTIPTSSQAGPSNSLSESQPSQPPADTPELQRLRERVQRLEAALDERGQDTNEDDEPDRPPPAYDSLPMEPAVGPGSNSPGGRGREHS